MIYPPGIVFEPQPLTGTTSTWLDIDVHLSRRRGLVLTPVQRELSWVIRECRVCQKHVVHPFIALWDLDATLLRSLIAGRITRWMQFHLSYNQLLDTLRHELRVWRRTGYPSRLLRDLWSNQRKSAQVRCFAQALLQDRSRVVRGPIGPDAEPEWFSPREA